MRNDTTTPQEATTLPSKGWAYRRIAVALGLAIAGLALGLIGAKIAAGTLFVAAAAGAVPLLAEPIGVLLAHRQQSVTAVPQ